MIENHSPRLFSEDYDNVVLASNASPAQDNGQLTFKYDLNLAIVHTNYSRPIRHPWNKQKGEEERRELFSTKKKRKGESLFLCKDDNIVPTYHELVITASSLLCIILHD